MNYTNYGIIAALLVVVIFVFLLTRLDDNKGAISRAESKAADLAQVSTGTADDQLSTVNWSSGPFHSTMSLEEARVVVPFHILTPMYLPDGYELWEDVIVHDAPPNEERFGAVVLQLIRDVPKNGAADSPVISVSQELGTKDNMSIVASLKRPPVDVGGFEAEVRLTSGSVHLLWDDPDRGVWIWVHGRIPSDDLLKVARSLR